MQHNTSPRCSGCQTGASPDSPPLKTLTFTVCHRGEFRRLCTSCVLKYHPDYFCPICFHVYDDESPVPASHNRRTCVSCPSIAHSSCVLPAVTCKSPPYQCPSCKNPNLKFFVWERDEIDENLAKQFVAAAEIAVISMKKAAEEAKENVERRVREAMRARVKAEEAVVKYKDIELLYENYMKNI